MGQTIPVRQFPSEDEAAPSDAQHPVFYRQLGKEPEQITQGALEALANRFRLPFR